jgi:hypothetical protein
MVNRGTIMVETVESRVNAVAARDMVGLWLDLVQFHIKNSKYLLLVTTSCYIRTFVMSVTEKRLWCDKRLHKIDGFAPSHVTCSRP